LGEEMNLLHDIPIGEKAPDEVNMIVEIPKGSSNKYEYNNEKGYFELDRVLYSATYYPGDYGFIAQTWFEDDDPIDAIVLSTNPNVVGCVVKIRPVALMRMEDEKGIDDKIVGVPVKDPRFAHIKDLKDIPEHVKKEITEFFETMKKLEPGKWVKVKQWQSASEAKRILKKSEEIYKKKFG